MREIGEAETGQFGRDAALGAARPFDAAKKADSTEALSACAGCAIRPLNICGSLVWTNPDAPLRPRSDDWQVHRKTRAGRNIKSAGETLDRVDVICAGWAFRFVQLLDGRKHVLSILSPGDVITPTRPFEARVRFSVQAATDVRFCGYSRQTLKERLATDPRLSETWADLIVAERLRNLGLLIDLGCRSAEERIAHLLLDLRARLQQRGLASEGEPAMPLSRRLIAGATGLTPEHVSRVIGGFLKQGLVETGTVSLTIRDPEGLQSIGQLNV